MPILNPHTGQAFSSANLKRHVTLTARDGEILQHITQWEYIHQLRPMLVCKTCWNNARITSGPDTGRGGDTNRRDEWEIVLSFTDLAVIAECACTKWATERPAPLTAWLGRRNIPHKDVVELIESTPILVQKKEPITDDEAALLQAWKGVMDAHGWAEGLDCMACFESATKTGVLPDFSVHAVVTPGKRIAMNCACSIREWTGVTK